MKFLQQIKEKLYYMVRPDTTDSFSWFFSFRKTHDCGPIHFERLDGISRGVKVKIIYDDNPEVSGLIISTKKEFDEICKTYQLPCFICEVCGEPASKGFSFPDILNYNNGEDVRFCHRIEIEDVFDSYFGEGNWRPKKVSYDCVDGGREVSYEYRHNDSDWKEIPMIIL